MLKWYAVAGFFGDPSDGGNKDQIGWKLIGFEDHFYYASALRLLRRAAMKEKHERRAAATPLQA